jgi:biopolymer transport protein TolR
VAGGMDLGSGGRSRRKPLDAAINLVPFIDLMAVTISFLIMTAVWTQVSRLQVTQSGGPPSAMRGDKALELIVLVTERGYAISADRAPYAEIPKLAGRYDVSALDQKLKALHANFPDQRQVTVEVEDRVRYLDLVNAIDACVGNKLDAVSVSAAG